MKISPIQTGYSSLYKNQVTSKKSCSGLQQTSPQFKGMTGSLTGFCFGGVLGYFAPIGIALLGVPMGMLGATSILLLGCFGGAYGGDKLEDKIERKFFGNENK